ncbi:hypothetical protein BHYA_0211g00110 [Botrytis hyacinthi]|uniref:Uncharacterized protein n=1 Tax=Botrytis hyacinthi TaxID=278943 RepID=A0A4Z1GK36_9HELO|nr:hypothetical protein BHYA_0211g00110 [Botrytis hyacinthi]
MYTALNKLGYRCYDFLELTPRNKENSKLRHIACWLEALRYKVLGIGEPYHPAGFDKLLQGYSVAFSDMPCINFSDEMLAAFPNAKVVLTRREPVAWVKSLESSIYRVVEWRVWPFLRFIDPPKSAII